MIILSARYYWLLAVLAAVSACGGGPTTSVPLEVRQRFDLAGLPGVDVRLLVQPEHLRLQARYARAAMATLTQNSLWLGPFERRSVTIVDPAWRETAAADGRDVVMLDRTPWWNAVTSMTPELAVARALSRVSWADATATAELPEWFVRGLAEYAARRVVGPLFEAENLPPGYAFLEDRFFGGFVHRFVRVRLFESTDGEPLPAYRADPNVSPTRSPASAADARSLEAKTVLVLGTFERWVGRPVFDQVLAQFVQQARRERVSLTDFARVADAVSGQELAWFFKPALESSAVYDYGVERLVSDADSAGGFATTVVAQRYGDATFTGSSATPQARFEAGRGITLLVVFADGQRWTDTWDGRERSKTFILRSPARAVSATVDPGRTLLLDVKQTNNSRTLSPKAGSAATTWAARYLLWLENALLTYSLLA